MAADSGPVEQLGPTPPSPPPGYSADEVVPAPPQGYSEADVVPVDWKAPAPKQEKSLPEKMIDVMSDWAGAIGESAEKAGEKLFGGYGAKAGQPMLPAPPPGVGSQIASQITGSRPDALETQIVEGVGKVAGSLSTPGNMLMLGTLGGAGEQVGRTAGVLFGTSMLKSGSGRLKKAMETGDTSDMVQAGIELGMGLHSLTTSFAGRKVAADRPAAPPGYTQDDVVATQPLQAPEAAGGPTTELPPQTASAPAVDEMRPNEAPAPGPRLAGPPTIPGPPKQAPPVLVPPVEPTEAQVAEAEGRSPDVTVYHGSGNRFDSFSDDKLLSGEGAMSYGAGHYVAEAPPVAAEYAQDRSGIRLDGRNMRGGVSYSGDDEVESMAFHTLAEHNSIAEARADLLENAKQAELYQSLSGTGDDRDWPGMYRGAAAQIDHWQQEGRLKDAPGAIHVFKVPGEQVDRMLDLDEKLGNQPKEVEDAVTDILGNDSKHALTGQDAYDLIAAKFAGENEGMDHYAAMRAASKALLERGVPGNKYLDGYSRNNPGRITEPDGTDVTAHLSDRTAKSILDGAGGDFDEAIKRAEERERVGAEDWRHDQEDDRMAVGDLKFWKQNGLKWEKAPQTRNMVLFDQNTAKLGPLPGIEEEVPPPPQQPSDPVPQYLPESQPFQQADKVTYNGEEFFVKDVADGKVNLVRGHPDGSTEEMSVNENSKALERLPAEEREEVPAVKLKDGTVLVSTRGTHMSIATDMENNGIGWDQVASDGYLNRGTNQYRPGSASEILHGAMQDIGEKIGTEESGALTLGKGSPEEQAQARLRALAAKGKGYTARHALPVTEADSPEALSHVRAGAGSRGAGPALVGWRVVAPIDAELGKGAGERFVDAAARSNIEGSREKYDNFAAEARNMPDGLIRDRFKSEWKDTLSDVIDKTQPDKALARKQKAEITRAVGRKEWDDAREKIASTFEAARDSITPMTPEQRAYYQSPEWKRAKEIASPFLEQLQKYSKSGGAKETAFTGPGDQWFPLQQKLDETGSRPRIFGMNLPFSKRVVQSSLHRTGLGDYDTSITGFMRSVSSNFRAYHFNEALQALKDSGIAREVGKGGIKGTTNIHGFEEPTDVFKVTPDRTINGKQVPGKMIEMARSNSAELRPILEHGAKIMDTDGIESVKNAILGNALKYYLRGVAEPAYHGQAIVRNLAHAAGVTTPQAAYRIARFDMSDTENVGSLVQRMADAGQISNRYASVSMSRGLAKQFGAQYENPALTPVPGTKGGLSASLFGPHGIDMRARLSLLDTLDHFQQNKVMGFEKMSENQKMAALDQLGVYSSAIRTELQKSLAKTYLQPFTTASSTRIRNALEGLGLSDTQVALQGMDKAQWKLRQQFTSGIGVATATWIGLSKAITGKYPWEDKDSRLFQIPIPKEWEDSPVLKPFYSGQSGTRKYIGVGGFFGDAINAARLFGVDRGYAALMRGGNAKQVGDAAASQAISTVGGALFGPVPQIALAAAGFHPYLTSFYDPKTGAFSPQFLKSSAGYEKGGGAHLGASAIAAAEELNPITAGAYERASGQKPTNPAQARTQNLPKLFANMGVRGLLGTEENTTATRARMAAQRNKP